MEGDLQQFQSVTVHGIRLASLFQELQDALLMTASDIMQYPKEKIQRIVPPRECENPTWNSAEGLVTLHSFDFTKYRLWTSLFRRGTIVNGQIVAYPVWQL